MSMHVYAWNKQCYPNEALNKGKRGKLLLLATTQIFLGFEVFGLHLPMADFWLWATFFFAN